MASDNEPSMITLSSEPVLCVVISTKNAHTHLQECLDSVYAQTSSAWQVIVIDGGSTDGTVELIRRNASWLHYWTSESDSGVYDAWNKALPQITAEWVIFLGADDALRSPDVLAHMAPVLERNCGHTRIVYGWVELTDENGKVMRRAGRPWSEVAAGFRREMNLPHQGVFHHRSMFADGRAFDASFRYAGDYELLLPEALKRPPSFENYCVTSWRQGGITSSPGQSIRVLREFRRARAKHNVSGGHPVWTEIKAVVKYAMHGLFGGAATGKLLGVYRMLTK